MLCLPTLLLRVRLDCLRSWHRCLGASVLVGACGEVGSDDWVWWQHEKVMRETNGVGKQTRDVTCSSFNSKLFWFEVWPYPMSLDSRFDSWIWLPEWLHVTCIFGGSFVSRHIPSHDLKNTLIFSESPRMTKMTLRFVLLFKHVWKACLQFVNDRCMQCMDPFLFVQASLPNGSKRLRPLQEIRWNTSKLASNNPHRLRRARITRASGGWISSFNERSLTKKCKVDFEIFFKIHPMVFGDRWNIIKQPDAWEPTMNWTIDVKFCLRWNWRQSTLSSEKKWIFCPPPWLDTSGGIMVNTARCASTQAKVALVKLSHWQCWNFPSLSKFILFICHFSIFLTRFQFASKLPMLFDSGHLLLFFLETSLGSDLWETMPPVIQWPQHQS